MTISFLPFFSSCDPSRFALSATAEASVRASAEYLKKAPSDTDDWGVVRTRTRLVRAAAVTLGAAVIVPGVPAEVSVPAERTVNLLEELGIFFSSPAQAASYASADDAVNRAWSVESPDIAAISRDASANRDTVWQSFEPVTTEGFAKERAPYRDGYGTLFGPAANEVIRCRTESDPTCRAIQVLDKGFPERPAMSEDILTGRDEVVDNADGGSGGSGSAGTGCRPNIVHTPERVETETCSTGGFYSDLACRKGWEEGPALTLTRWRCTDTKDQESNFTCRVTSAFTTTPVWTSTCSYGSEASAPEKSFFRLTSATAKAVWPATCTAPQYVVSDTVCEDILSVTKQTTACTVGSVSTASNTGGADLAGDACPGGTVFTSKKPCVANEVTNRASFTLQLDRFPAATLRGPGFRSVTHSTTNACSCRYQVESVTCDNGTCIADLSATVFVQQNGVSRRTGVVTVRHVYTTEVAVWEESWTSTCPDVVKTTAGSNAETKAMPGGSDVAAEVLP